MQLLLNNDFITASNENLLLGEKTLLPFFLDDMTEETDPTSPAPNFYAPVFI